MSISIVASGLMVDTFGTIRINKDGLISVFDLIQVCAEFKGQDSKYMVWIKLTERFPEVLSKVEDFKFQGKGQKNTPVCTKETALEIIGLLPGATGKKYRALAAKLVLAYLENPAQLAENVIARTEVVSPEKLDNLAAQIKEAQHRVKGIESRKSFTDVVNDQGRHHYWKATDEVYDSMIGLRAKDIKKLATGNDKAKGSARSYLKDHAIRMLELIEGLAADVAADTGEDVVELAKECANQSTANLNPLFKNKLTDFRTEPLTPNKARKIASK